MKKRRFFQSSRSELICPMEKSAGRRIKTKKRRFFQSSRSELFCLVLVCIVYGCSLHQYGKAYRAAAAREIRVTDETKAMGTIYSALKEEIQIFPVDARQTEYTFEDSWGASRSYGGDRQHLGTDIMDTQNSRGRLRVRSMTDGVVTCVGWNQLGGWRVGITSDSGVYYYYAHLASYASGLAVGNEVKAGEWIGMMGDSGYGEEGTTGQFAVHLHVGILLDEQGKGEEWVNPYPFLKSLIS